MTDPVLRPARPDDTDALVDVWRRAVEATHDFLAPDDVRELEAAVRDEYLGAVDLTGAAVGGRGGGVGGAGGPRVGMLFVDPVLHGRGIGRALLDAVGRGLPVVELDVNEQNPGALAFYRALGFEVTGRSETDDQGRPFPLLHLRREA